MAFNNINAKCQIMAKCQMKAKFKISNIQCQMSNVTGFHFDFWHLSFGILDRFRRSAQHALSVDRSSVGLSHNTCYFSIYQIFKFKNKGLMAFFNQARCKPSLSNHGV